MGRGRGRQGIPPGVQIAHMQARYPRLKVIDRAHLIWQGPVQPREGGMTFTLWIRVRRPDGLELPQVRVVSPRLVNRPGSTVPPHVYPGGNLCLYHPDEYWWTSDQFVADTIVPWACEWCYYYEIWLETGKWAGPEYPHTGPKRGPKHPEPPETRTRAA